MNTASVKTRQHCQLIDVTSEVNKAVRGSGVKNGYVICFVPHTTAGLTIQENADPDVIHDLLWKLEDLIPNREGAYQHGEGNSDAHIKTSLVGSSETVLIEDGRLVLGTWQGIYFCEFDGPRQRKLMIQCFGNKA
jgi:secondary thiamine-phosphate synthase enzyme